MKFFIPNFLLRDSNIADIKKSFFFIQVINLKYK